MRSLQRLAGHFLDVVAGLPTLKVFGRAKAQARAIADVTDRYRTTTMATLKLTFLSSLVLELLATVSVALVAVAVGLRLLDADMQFRAALFVLVLAPEAYLPLRALGANFHASADGMKAAEQIFELLETPVGDAAVRRDTIRPKDTSIHIAASRSPTPAPDPRPARADLVVEPGEVVALTGPSGCGKSTLLDVVLGLRRPVRVTSSSAGWTCATSTWRRGAPDRLGAPAAPPLCPHRRRQRAPRVAPTHPTPRWRTRSRRPACRGPAPPPPGRGRLSLGDGGAGLSAGERQRLALARAFVRDAPSRPRTSPRRASTPRPKPRCSTPCGG